MKKLFKPIALCLCMACGQAAAQTEPSACAYPLFDAPSPRQEVRAVWLTTLSGLDWPGRPQAGPEGAARQKAELCAILDRLQAAGLNTVLFQARVRSTTAYPSELEPWDGAFTGEPGRAPAFDPLAFAVEECHRRKMEIHAWVVAFPICKVAVAKRLGKRALPARRPELCFRAGDQWMMDPGVPATADYLADLCREITARYDVDGIHLDYIRYPEKGIPFDDRATYRRYGRGKPLAQWRTENVDRCVRAIHDAVKAVRPWVKLSCSPVGKYADLTRYSSRGWNARDAVNQDAQRWLREGWMDMLFPMMYFDGNHFYPFALDWMEEAGGKPVVPGLGIYFLHPKEKDWGLGIVRRQLNFLRSIGIGGEAYFRSRFLTDNVKGLYDELAEDFYRQAALLPPMKGTDSLPPAAPAVELARRGNKLQLSWQAVADDCQETPVSYNVYRYDGENPPARWEGNSWNGVRLLAHGLRQPGYSYVPALPVLLRGHYAVTAVDAYGNESGLCWVRGEAEPVPALPVPVCDSLLAVPGHFSDADFLLVTDATGRQLITCRLAPQIDVSALAPGFYELRSLGRKGGSHRFTGFYRR